MTARSIPPSGSLRLLLRGAAVSGALWFAFPLIAHAATLYPTSPRHWQGYAGRSWVGAVGGNTSDTANWASIFPYV